MPYTDIATEDTGPDAPEVFRLPPDVLPDRLDKTLARLMPRHSRRRNS